MQAPTKTLNMVLAINKHLKVVRYQDKRVFRSLSNTASEGTTRALLKKVDPVGLGV